MDKRKNEFNNEDDRYMARTASYVLLPEAMLHCSNGESENRRVYGFMERMFKVSERGSTWKTEIKAGFFNFVATSYQLVLVPQILRQCPHSLSQVEYFNAYVLAIGSTSVIAGLSSNLPVSLGFGIGCCALFVPLFQQGPDSSHDTQGIDQTSQTESVACLLAALTMLALSMLDWHWRMYTLLPPCLVDAVPVGLGMLMLVLGLAQMEVLKDSSLGNLLVLPTLLGLVGCVVSAWLHPRAPNLSILLPMALLACMSWTLVALLPQKRGYLNTDAVVRVTLPDFSSWVREVGKVSLTVSVDMRLSVLDWGWSAARAAVLYLCCFCDVGGITFGLARIAHGVFETNPDSTSYQKRKGAQLLFISCALGSVFSSLIGGVPVIVSGGALMGYQSGGRTGMTTVVSGLCMILALPLSPILIAVAPFASAPVLVMLGTDMLGLAQFLHLSNKLQALSTVLLVALMPFLFHSKAALAIWLILPVLTIKGVWKLTPPAVDNYSLGLPESSSDTFVIDRRTSCTSIEDLQTASLGGSGGLMEECVYQDNSFALSARGRGSLAGGSCSPAKSPLGHSSWNTSGSSLPSSYKGRSFSSFLPVAEAAPVDVIHAQPELVNHPVYEKRLGNHAGVDFHQSTSSSQITQHVEGQSERYIPCQDQLISGTPDTCEYSVACMSPLLSLGTTPGSTICLQTSTTSHTDNGARSSTDCRSPPSPFTIKRPRSGSISSDHPSLIPSCAVFPSKT